MRVTDSMIHMGVQDNIQRAMQRLNKHYNQLTTGKMINRPSDDPVGLILGMRLKKGITENEQYKENVNAALALLNGSDYALDEMTKALQRLEELAVQGANGTLDEISLNAIANEVEELRNHLYQIANTKQENTYIFGGEKTTTPPYELDTTTTPPGVNWQGSLNPLKAEVGPGIVMKVTVPGDRIFGTFFDELAQFIDNLRNGNFRDISANDITNIQNRLDEVLQIRGEIGAKVNRLEKNVDRMELMDINFRELLSKIEDTDYAEVTMNLMMQESVYQAALATSARIMRSTLVNYI